MTLEEIPTVRLGSVDKKDTQKYLVIELVDPQKERKVIVWAVAESVGSTVKTMKILQELAVLVSSGVRVNPLGGGIIVPRPPRKRILVTPYNGRFGHDPDHERTLRLLKEHMPEYTFDYIP